MWYLFPVPYELVPDATVTVYVTAPLSAGIGLAIANAFASDIVAVSECGKLIS